MCGKRFNAYNILFSYEYVCLRYMCPQLAVLLKMKYNILSVGTCRTNRKGWPKDILNMKENSTRKGDYLLTYDMITQVACMQWRDSKVVNLVSTLNDSQLSTCQRREGEILTNLSVPNDYNQYGKRMFGVDKGDQARSHFGGFANRAHFQKWYKKVYLAILDCCVLNAHAAWNMSCIEVFGRKELKRHQFMWALSIELLQYKDPQFVTIEVPRARASIAANAGQGIHVPIQNRHSGRKRCFVCQLEVGTSQINESGNRNNGVCVCGNEDCFISAHNYIPRDNQRKIRHLPQFENLTCFEIAHHPASAGLWKFASNGYRRCPSHPLVRKLKSLHGLTPTLRRERRRGDIIDGTNLFPTHNAENV